MTKFSDAFYAEPNKELKRRKLLEYRHRFIEPFFPKDRTVRILDLGAGYGLFLAACRSEGYERVAGVEADEAFVAYAKEEFGIDTIACDDLFIYLESQKDGSVDVITAFNIVEHVKRERVPVLLSLIRRKLAPGGLFIMEVPNADSPLGVHTYFSDLTHKFAYSKKLTLRLLAMAGFERLQVRYEPNLRHLLIRIAQRVVAKLFGLERDQLFSGNIVLIGHAS